MRALTSSLVVRVLLIAAFCSEGNVVSSSSKWSGKISESLKSELAKNPTTDIIVSLKIGTSSAIQKFHSKTEVQSSRQSRIESLVSTLEQNANVSQNSVINLLAKSKLTSMTIKSLWITNQIAVMNANAELVSSLAHLDEVGKIDLNEIIELIEPVTSKAALASNGAWGVEKIRAPEVWKTTAGEGVIVATIDTGVLVTHEALKDNYIGQNGWFDPYQKTRSPNDQNGHGTHVTGTIIGRLGIDVAPNATWLSCKGCNDRTCSQIALLECGQFIVCPTLPDGTGKDCSKTPHIVSNSWGGGQGQNTYAETVKAWHEAGIIPVFSNGNEGPDCGTAGSPGDLPNVIAVGATTELDGFAGFSSVGPSVRGTMKPDISAPGENIKSASNHSNNGYVLKSGTSMACPHVAGVIALLKSVNPDMTYDEVKSAIFNGASTILERKGESCGGISDNQFPNNFYGYGKIDAVKTMMRLQSDGSTLQFSVLLCGSLLLILKAI